MARALAQRREYAIRLALGASVASLRRLTLVSTLRACAPGMALACVVACWLIRVLATVVPRNYYYAASLPTLAAVAIGFTAVVVSGHGGPSDACPFRRRDQAGVEP